MKHVIRLVAVALLCVTTLVPFTASVASAHGHEQVGDYELVIGFRNEPAYQGEPNGLDLRVTNQKTGEPVTGLEDTLKAELIYADAKVEFALEPSWGEEGAYTADVIPTKAGAYTWRIFGTIETTPVDLSMTAGPEAFSEVQAKDTVSFPAAEPTTDEILQQVAQSRMYGLGGLALGALGLAIAAFALFSRRAPQPQPQAARRQNA
jgi:hypothetical protein